MMLHWYPRVLPRDLFNEASLLKCVGALALAIHDQTLLGFSCVHDGAPFSIHQNTADGSLRLSNVGFAANGKSLWLYRPLNSRDPWPLYCITSDGEEYNVFNEDGTINASFRSLGRSDG